MIALSALVHLPVTAVAAFGLVMIATHNAFDGLKASALGAGGPLWTVFHEGGNVDLGAGQKLAASYPLIPWIGVMAAGYGCGHLLLHTALPRRALLLRLGVALTAAFVILRLSNLYGDAAPTSHGASASLSSFSPAAGSPTSNAAATTPGSATCSRGGSTPVRSRSADTAARDTFPSPTRAPSPYS